CQAGTYTSMAIGSDQRLVELAEYQSLAVVRRLGRVRWIGWVVEGNGRNRFARVSDQRTVGGSGFGTERRRRRRRRERFWRGGNWTRGFWRSVRLRRDGQCSGSDPRAAGRRHRLKRHDEPKRDK